MQGMFFSGLQFGAFSGLQFGGSCLYSLFPASVPKLNVPFATRWQRRDVSHKHSEGNFRTTKDIGEA